MKLKKIEIIICIFLLIMGIIFIKSKIDEEDNMDLILETNTDELVTNTEVEEKNMINKQFKKEAFKESVKENVKFL